MAQNQGWILVAAYALKGDQYGCVFVDRDVEKLVCRASLSALEAKDSKLDLLLGHYIPVSGSKQYKGKSRSSRVRQGMSRPSFPQTMLDPASAIARAVVALPPVMVIKPSTPSCPWSKHLKVRLHSRPDPPSSGPNERPGRGPGGAERRLFDHGD